MRSGTSVNTDLRKPAMLPLVAGLALGLAASVSLAQNEAGEDPQDRSPALIPQPDPQLGQGQPAGSQAQDDSPIIIGPFAEPVELRTLLDIAVQQLGVQLAVDTSVVGSVMITQEIRVPRSKFLLLVNSFLEQRGFTMIPGPLEGFYDVVSKTGVPSNPTGPPPTTLVIRTPNTKPSVLQAAIVSQVTSGGRIAALDELGVLIVTASPGEANEVKRLVDRILSERNEQKFIPYDLTHVSASAARSQVLLLAGVPEDTGQAMQGGVLRSQQGGSGNQGAAALSGALSNLAERLIVAPSGNRLLFRGTADEADRVAELIDMVDIADNLIPRRYSTGSSTANVAALAEQRGLGAIIQFSSMDQQGALGGISSARLGGVQGGQNPLGQRQQPQGGSAIVVDEVRQSIVFYGTPQQHEQFAALVAEYDPGDEQVVIRNYELEWARAEQVATLLMELVEGASAATSDLLPGGGQTSRQSSDRQPRVLDQQAPVDGSIGDVKSPDAYVAFDEPTNQVMVRAPMNMQPEFRRLIQSIDKRRPQVFIEAKIVAVTWTDDMRLAFESQIINAGGSEGLFQSFFGLTNPNGDIQDPNIVDDGLLGFTSAVIRSNYVPFVINAFQRNVNGRILASPQLLVDNNTEARISSEEQQPTTTSSQGDATTETSFGGYQSAGPVLTVTPQINPGGFVTLSYDLTLSNFVGQGSDGIPAPQQTRQVASDSVTIPTDSTIIVGGITLDSDSDTKVGIPLLSKIPIFGYLFSDTNWNESKTTLYVFITPKVLYDPTIRDYELITEGPRRIADLDEDMPPLETYMVRVMVPVDFTPGTPEPEMPVGDEYGIEIIEPGS